MKNGEHILSAFNSRTGSSCDVAELRLGLNGWTAQLLLHTIPDASSAFDKQDLLAYCADKSVPSGKPIVNSVLNAIKGSKPVVMRYDIPAEHWYISFREPEDGSTVDFASIGQQLRDMRKSRDADKLFGFRQANGVLCSSLVYDWRGEAKFDMSVLGSVSATLSVWSSDQEQRFYDPRAWFEAFLRSNGVPMERFKFIYNVHPASSSEANSFTIDNTWDGRFTSNLLDYPGNSSSGRYDQLRMNGCTTIIGPMDLTGNRPVYRGPLLGNNLLVVLDDASVYLDVSFGAGSLNYATGIITPSLSGPTLAACDAAWAQYITNPILIRSGAGAGALPNCKDLEVCRIVTTEGGKAWAYGQPSGAWLNLGSSYVPYVTAAGLHDYGQLIDSKWRLAIPLGFMDIYVPGGLAVWTAPQVGSIGVMNIAPTHMGIRMTLTPMRTYLQNIIDDTTSSAKEIADAKVALSKSADYADAVMSTTVYGHDITPASRSMVEGLELIAVARKGDVDLLNYDLGSGKTFNTAAGNLNALRDKGTKFYAFTYLVDEAADVQDLVSEQVARTLSLAGAWALSATQGATGGEYTFSGVYNNGPSMDLTATEVAMLRTYGASLTAPLSDSFIAETMGFGAGFKEELKSVGTAIFTSSHTAPYFGIESLPYTVVKPADFCNHEGYPVADYPDMDTTVRAQVMLKGFGDDQSNMVCAMFFTNQLDIESA